MNGLFGQAPAPQQQMRNAPLPPEGNIQDQRMREAIRRFDQLQQLRDQDPAAFLEAISSFMGDPDPAAARQNGMPLIQQDRAMMAARSAPDYLRRNSPQPPGPRRGYNPTY